MESMSKKILNGVFFTMLEKISVAVFSFATFLVIVNHISLKDYGLLQLLFALSNPIVAISMVGIERLLVSDVAVYRAKEAYGVIGKLYQEYFWMVSVVFFSVLVATWFLRPIASHYYDIDVNYYFFALALFSFAQLAMNFTSIMFESYEKFDYSFYAKTVEAVTRTLIVFSFFFVFGFSLHSVLWAYVIGKLMAALISVPIALGLVVASPVPREERKILFRIIKKHGKWEMLSKVFRVCADNSAPWVVNFFVSTEAVALFAFVQKINTFFTSALPVRGILAPILSRSIAESRERAVYIATKLKKYMLVIYTFFYVLIFFFTEPFLAAFVPQYIGAVNMILLAMLHLFIDILTMGQPVVFYALKQQKINFKMAVYSTISTLSAQALCTYVWGASGPIIAWLFVGVTGGSYREYLLRTKLHFSLLHFRSLITYDDYDRFVIAQIKEKLSHVLRKFSFSK